MQALAGAEQYLANGDRQERCLRARAQAAKAAAGKAAGVDQPPCAAQHPQRALIPIIALFCTHRQLSSLTQCLRSSHPINLQHSTSVPPPAHATSFPLEHKKSQRSSKHSSCSSAILTRLSHWQRRSNKLTVFRCLSSRYFAGYKLLCAQRCSKGWIKGRGALGVQVSGGEPPAAPTRE